MPKWFLKRESGTKNYLLKLKDILIRLPYEKKVTGIEAIGWRWQAKFED
ncbi:hypothetical protein [Carboxydothermus islandicus]|nr:hypothetical protein [Carboxydothermus islandicus]